MLNLYKAALIALVLAAGLAGCGAQDIRQGISDAGTTVSQNLSQAAVDQLTAQLPNIDQTIAAGNTEEARAAFTQFMQSWDTVKVAVQQLAPESATAIQNAIDGVKQALIDTPTPSAAEVRAALDELEKQLLALGGLVP